MDRRAMRACPDCSAMLKDQAALDKHRDTSCPVVRRRSADDRAPRPDDFSIWEGLFAQASSEQQEALRLHVVPLDAQ